MEWKDTSYASKRFKDNKQRWLLVLIMVGQINRNKCFLVMILPLKTQNWSVVSIWVERTK